MNDQNEWKHKQRRPINRPSNQEKNYMEEYTKRHTKKKRNKERKHREIRVEKLPKEEKKRMLLTKTFFFTKTP